MSRHTAIASALLCILLTGNAARSANPLTGATWIWHGKPGSSLNVPGGTWCFRRCVNIPADRRIRGAVCTITADNGFTLWVNGKKVGGGDDWTRPGSFDLTKALKAGKNVLAVEATNLHLISAGNEPEYTPAVLPNGRILYTRWEYTDKELMRIQSLWTMNPDGTGVTVFWGNQSYWPDLLMEARPIPGSDRVMFAGHGHHDVYWGSVGIIDHSKGLNYPDGLTKVTQDVRWCEVGDGPQETPETQDYHTAGPYRGYKSPYPLSDELFLVSARHAGKGSKYKIFLMDVYGNREVIYEGEFHAMYAMPIRPRRKPPVIPDRIQSAGAQKDGGEVRPGTFYSPDVYEGAPDVLRGKAKYLRVIKLDHNTMTIGKKYQDASNTRHRFHMHAGPVVSAVVNDAVKKVLGIVKLEADNSIYFQAPPCVPLHFQLLDANHRALHTMRSFTSVMPGENRGCVGCHESQVARGNGISGPGEDTSAFDAAQKQQSPRGLHLGFDALRRETSRGGGFYWKVLGVPVGAQASGLRLGLMVSGIWVLTDPSAQRALTLLRCLAPSASFLSTSVNWPSRSTISSG